MVYRSVWGSSEETLATGLFVLMCVTDVGLHYFLLNFNRWLSFPQSTHVDRQSVNISVTVSLYVSLFVILSFCTVTDLSARDKASGVKFCTMVHARPGHGISHFGEF